MAGPRHGGASPAEFAKSAIRLAIRRFGLPRALEESAFVDGFGDLGIDGLAMALGDTPLTDPDAILNYYSRLGPAVVALKMGESGVYLATPRHRVKIPAFSVAVVDATGAGDTFRGAFLARILAGDEPEPVARYAVFAAALQCTGHRAAAPIPSPEQVKKAAGVLDTP